MDLSKYSIEDLILLGIKSEIEAARVYRETAERVKNPFLKTRLEALSREEEKHREVLENLYHKFFPGKEIALPENPDYLPEFPEVNIFREISTTTDIRTVLEKAMMAEMSAKEYYEEISRMVEDENLARMMRYMAKIEEGHYNILKMEYEDMQEFENIMGDANYVEFDARF